MLSFPPMIDNPGDLRFDRDGAQRLGGAVEAAGLQLIEAALRSDCLARAGVRLHGSVELAGVLGDTGVPSQIARSMLGLACWPVRAVLFDKTSATNWSLGWHQDRTIVVRQRIETPGFGPWTTKQGLQHVAPPIEILEGMATLRIHLDDTQGDNAPLLIAPGSHKLGSIPVNQVANVVKQCGTAVCLAERGDIWAYSTPILHASELSRAPMRRRVLQIDYASVPLPKGLDWLGLL